MKKISFFSIIFFTTFTPLLCMELQHKLKTTRQNRKTLLQRRGYIADRQNYDVEAACYNEQSWLSKSIKNWCPCKPPNNMQNPCSCVAWTAYILSGSASCLCSLFLTYLIYDKLNES